MYEDIAKNKRQTWLIVFGFLTIITLIIYYVLYALDFGPVSIVLALIFSIASTIATYYNCDKIVLKSVGARPATREEDLQLTNILDGLMVASGLEHRPRLYVQDCAQPNAFATGRDPEHSAICVTTGLLSKLEYYELEGVVAHELSHVKNYDIRLQAIVSVMVGVVTMLSDFCFRVTWRSSGSKRSSRDNDNSAVQIILLLVGAILLILAPLIGQIIQLALSRRREYLADATGAAMTRNPDGLISALRKIAGDEAPMATVSGGNAHLYISSPFRMKDGKKTWMMRWFETHPPIADRIAALEKLK